MDVPIVVSKKNFKELSAYKCVEKIVKKKIIHKFKRKTSLGFVEHNDLMMTDLQTNRIVIGDAYKQTDIVNRDVLEWVPYGLMHEYTHIALFKTEGIIASICFDTIDVLLDLTPDIMDAMWCLGKNKRLVECLNPDSPCWEALPKSLYNAASIVH